MHVWNVLHAAHWKYGTQKWRKNRNLRNVCRTISSQLKHVSMTGKKLVKQQYLLHMSSPYGEFRPTNGWDRLAGLGHPSKFQWVLRLGFVTAATSFTGGQPNFARCLAVSCAGTLCIHLRGLLLLDGVLLGAYFTLRPSLAFSHIFCITARHLTSGRQPNFAAWYKEWNYGTFADGATYIRLGCHLVGHRPTF